MAPRFGRRLHSSAAEPTAELCSRPKHDFKVIYLGEKLHAYVGFEPMTAREVLVDNPTLYPSKLHRQLYHSVLL